MQITRRSILTGETHTRFIAGLTAKKLVEYQFGNKPIQKVFPNLSADDREFIKTGITPEEWTVTVGDR